MKTKIEHLRKLVTQSEGKLHQIDAEILATKEQLVELRKSIVRHEQAKEILKSIGLKTQQQLQYHISDIASLALDAVFEEPYELLLEFVERRDKTECDIVFAKEGEKVNPLTESGGGAVDIAAFALRIASWSMQYPKTRNTIFLDEPMKNLSPEYRERGSNMLKTVSQRLGIQLIIINHEPILTSNADKVIRIGKKGKFSKILTE